MLLSGGARGLASRVSWCECARGLGSLRTWRTRALTHTTSNNGYLGSRNDEERSEMRYVVRIAGCKRVIESLNAYCARGSGRGHVCLSVSRYPQLRLLGATLDLAVPDVSSGSAEAQWRASPPQVFGVRTIRRGKWDASRTLSTGVSGKRGAWRQPAGALFSFAPAKLFFTF